jgi:hypothetical protein
VIKAYFELLVTFLRTRKELRSWIFAHVLVPVITVGAAAHYGSGKGPMFTATGSVSVIELVSELDANGRTTVKPGLGVIVQPEDSQTTLDMSTTVRTLRSSLTVDEVRANRSKIEMNDRHVVLGPPFFYVTSPALFILDGKPPTKAGIPGGEADLSEYAPSARHSPALVVSLLLVVSFTIGLGFAARSGTVLLQVAETIAAAAEK